MAQRPVYIPALEGPVFVTTKLLEFEWFPGRELEQKQKSIASLHAAACELPEIDTVLEISTRSAIPLGAELSAFNLSFTPPELMRRITVECAYQGSKVFENGGPYDDLFLKTPKEAKLDTRLQESGLISGYSFLGQEWDLEPKAAFYSWLYLNAFHASCKQKDAVSSYSAFTDIEFNPQRSINCQAHSVALYISLQKRGLLNQALASKEAFLDICGQEALSNSSMNESRQEAFQF